MKWLTKRDDWEALIMCGWRRLIVAMVLCVCATREARPGQARTGPTDVPAPYKSTGDQAGHDLVKTEQFVVPVGTSVFIGGLENEMNPPQPRIIEPDASDAAVLVTATSYSGRSSAHPEILVVSVTTKELSP